MSVKSGEAQGEINGDDVTGLLIDFSFEWRRSAEGYGPFTDARLSAFQITIWATVTLMPQNTVVFSSFQMIPDEASPSNGVMIGISPEGGGACPEPGSLQTSRFLQYGVAGDFIPVDPDPVACLRNYGDPQYPAEVECLPIASEVAKILVTTQNEEGIPVVWACSVHPNVYGTEIPYGWHLEGTVRCDRPVSELGVSIVPVEGEPEAGGECIGIPIVHKLGDPGPVGIVQEILDSPPDEIPSKVACFYYKKKLDLPCSEICVSTTVHEIRFQIIFPYGVSDVDESSVTVTAKPAPGQEKFCYPSNQYWVVCSFQQIEVLRYAL